MGAPEEIQSRSEIEKNYSFEFTETNTQASGSMGLATITKREIVVMDGIDAIGVIPVDGYVIKRDLGADNTTRISYNNEVAILRHLEQHETKVAPKVTIEGDEIKTEYIRGVSGTLIKYGRNVFTAVEVARLLLRSQIELVNTNIAYLDLKPENYKMVVDKNGKPIIARIFDFGNASLIDNGYIEPGGQHVVRGFPPEVFIQAVDDAKRQEAGYKPGFIEQAIKKISPPPPIVANKAVVYATGKHFQLILEPARFSRSAELDKSPEYRELMRLTESMTQREPNKRITLKELWQTVNDIAQPTKAGACVHPEIREILIKRGEIPLNWKEYATEEQIQEVLAKGPTKKS